MSWRIFSAVTAVVVVIASIFMWATDFVTLQGEWTIYTADCVDGQWQGSTCSGHMTAGERYRFRVLKAHREVLFWTIGDDRNESGRFLNCVVQDGRTWTCPGAANAAQTITRRMTLGVPHDEKADGILSVHRVPKWKWEALKHGVPVGQSALN
jgi:hypothetical protein